MLHPRFHIYKIIAATIAKSSSLTKRLNLLIELKFVVNGELIYTCFSNALQIGNFFMGGFLPFLPQIIISVAIATPTKVLAYTCC